MLVAELVAAVTGVAGTDGGDETGVGLTRPEGQSS